MSEEIKALTLDTINVGMRNAQHGVRGKLTILGDTMTREIEKAKAEGKPSPYPFKSVVFCNIGNPQQLRQHPLTFVRQVTSLVEYPTLIEKAPQDFAPDAIERAKKILKYTGFGTGPYSHSKGIFGIRCDIADFITARDGHPESPCDPESIYMTDGATVGVKEIIETLIHDEKCGIMIPIPQYPLYSATMTVAGGRTVPYYLNEEHNWSLDLEELNKAYNKAVAEGTNVRAIVVINPNNPTGQVLPPEEIEDIIKFCHEKHLAIIADEVYQENIYRDDIKFVSFRKCMLDMGYNGKVEIVSFHSTSKGFFGECGKRGGYFQLEGVLPEIDQQFYKTAALSLCPNTVGQVVMDCMVAPPKPGDASYELYAKERKDILDSLKRRAEYLSTTLNSLEGYQCSKPTAAMYLFPRVILPQRAIDHAKEAGVTPDFFYCDELLKGTGICVVPGSGFGEREGTFHYRITFLPPEEDIVGVMDILKKFHEGFMAQWK